MKNTQYPSKDIIDAIIKIDNEEDCIDFLNDLCTIQELEKMSQRIEAAKLLLEIIQNGDCPKENRIIKIEPEIVIGNSCKELDKS